MKKALVVVAVVVLVVLALPFLLRGGKEGVNPKEAASSPVVTLDEYNRVKEGMTYEEVVRIIGVEGKLTTEHNSKQTVFGQQFGSQLRNYRWENDPMSFVSLGFTDGKVRSKFMHGLE